MVATNLGLHPNPRQRLVSGIESAHPTSKRDLEALSVPRKRRSGDFTLRVLRDRHDYDACVELQRMTWGANFTERVPPSLQMVTEKMGGVVAGAFDPPGTMVGFVYGMTGLRHGRLAHWSHMLAVREELQGLGLGRRLKHFQRELLVDLGVEVIFWTYDPLVARNAHLNLNRLGAIPQEYVEDMYGGATDSDLHSGLGTDRFVVAWEIRGAHVDAHFRGERLPDPSVYRDVPIVNEGAGEHDLPAAAKVRIEIPPDIMAVKRDSADTAWRWRRSTRRAIQEYLERGYRVETFYRAGDGRCFYVVTSEGTGAP